MTYFDFSKLKFSLSYCTECVRIIAALVTTVWHLSKLHKCDVTGKVRGSGTAKVEMRKL